jgi:23S rRNA pseudouridine2604 synthase
MGQGVDIEGYRTRPAEVEQLDDRTFSIILTEGKKHQIRRMCIGLGFQVQSLKRVRVMNIELDGLKPGGHREIEGKELEQFLKKLGL